MEKIYQQLEQATTRMDNVVVLAGMLSDGDNIPDVLRDLLDEEPDALAKCFPEMPKSIARIDDSEEFQAAFFGWVLRNKKLGFVVQFARPVMKWDSSGRSASYSWGRYNTTWIYGDTLAQAVKLGLAWAKARKAIELGKPQS